MFNPDDGAGEAAIGYADQFLDASVKKIDKTFGKGFAKENPALVQAYIHACSINLSAFMHAAVGLGATSAFDDLLDEQDDR